MEKSIETIWKEGFLAADALVAPKLNNLYTQKSIHIVEKFKRMFRTNLWAIVIGAILFLGLSFVVGLPVMGIMLLLIAGAIVLVNRILQKRLMEIDPNMNSYEYIKSFDRWLKEQIDINARMARFYYPFFFLAMVMGFWFSDYLPLITRHLPSIYLVNGIPVFWILGVLIIMGILYAVGGRLYKWDLHIVYGRILKKLDEILSDMERLRG
jgi:hypothetical protein